MDNYKKALNIDKKDTLEYYKKSLIKTEQQKFLEELIAKDNVFINAQNIGDLACGGGTLSYHLSNLVKNTNFFLIDNNEDAINLAQDINKNKNNFLFFNKDIYNLEIEDNFFDIIFLWQTLSWLQSPKRALEEIIRVTKRGGKIYISSLFNVDNDVDIYSTIYDYTRESTKKGIYLTYNTYSKFTINNWISNLVEEFEIIRFCPKIKFKYKGRGLGTYTKKCENEYIQISGGMLLNWGVLVITV